jgi:hypothetical protein
MLHFRMKAVYVNPDQRRSGPPTGNVDHGYTIEADDLERI